MRLKEKLQGIVPEEYLCRLSNRFHVIGDIAVLSLPCELKAYKKEIALGVLSQGNTSGLFSIRQLDLRVSVELPILSIWLGMGW